MIEFPFKERVLCVSGIGEVDFERLQNAVHDKCAEWEYEGNCLMMCWDDEKVEGTSDLLTPYKLVLKGWSTQGLRVEYIHGSSHSVKLDIPVFASDGDIAMAFAILEFLRSEYPECDIVFNQDGDNEQFSVSEDNNTKLVNMSLHNLLALLESIEPGSTLGAKGDRRTLYFQSLAEHTDQPLNDIVIDAMLDFVDVQWAYEYYNDAEIIDMAEDEDAEELVALLGYEGDIFVEPCDKVAVYNRKGDRYKLIPVESLRRQLENSPYFEPVDCLQFALREMPKKEWDKFYKSLEDAEPERMAKEC